MWEQGLPAMDALRSCRDRGACIASKLCSHNPLATKDRASLRTGKFQQLCTPRRFRRQRQERRIQQRLTRWITERFAAQVQHLATRTFQYTLGGGGVPLGGRRQPWIAICRAFGHQAKLQRTANTGQLQLTQASAQAVQQAFLLRAGVPATGNHREGFTWRQCATNRDRQGLPSLSPRQAPSPAPPT